MSYSKRTRRVFTEEERREYREAKRTEQRERFAEAISELATSEGWQRWVETRALFHRYSFGNCALIAMQRPDATMVASYKTWQKCGRQVRRGEKGISILAPCKVKVRTAEQSSELAKQYRDSQKGLAPRPGSIGSDTVEADTRLFFKSVHVFDVSQTEGDDLPELERHPITGDSHSDYLPKLEAVAESIGFRIEFRDLSDHPAGGWCNYAENLIVVDSAEPINAQVRVLVHELAHAKGISSKEYGRELAEVIVETAAVIVCGSIGLDTSGESVPYVAGWAEGDASLIREYAETVDKVARELESAIGIDELALYSEAEAA